jgi:hypothetical protein
LAPTLKSVNNRKKGKELSAREKAILFAKNVPKPKQQNPLSKKDSKNNLMGGSPQK